jgi:hypothetical protein
MNRIIQDDVSQRHMQNRRRDYRAAAGNARRNGPSSVIAKLQCVEDKDIIAIGGERRIARTKKKNSRRGEPAVLR